jgi:EF hand
MEKQIMNVKAIIATAAVAILAAGAASAQNMPSKSTTDFAAVDANKDGHISKDEVRSRVALSGAFSKLDTNSDNMLSEVEFDKYAGDRSESPSTGSVPETSTAPAGSTVK